MKRLKEPELTPRIENDTEPVDDPIAVPGSPPSPPASHERSERACATLAEAPEPSGHVIVSDEPAMPVDTVPALVVNEYASLVDCRHVKQGLPPLVIENERIGWLGKGKVSGSENVTT